MRQITQTRLVPVAVIDDVADAVPVAEALHESGVDIIEVTFRTAAAPEAIREIVKAFPDMLVGAGTLLDIYQVEQALQAGAKFGVAPGLNENVILKAIDLEFPFIPGVMTPSDVEKGLSLGCKLLKFFPAEAAGGIKMLKSMAGPYSHTGVKFIPLGGVNAANAVEYLREPIVAAIGGSWFVERKLVQARDWKTIRRLTAEALNITSTG
jgi:2-dehydro-3-deoxyphosphogluconate aldolase / (4S)-4-hydroxy-2-oxoglutarate aldolase